MSATATQPAAPPQLHGLRALGIFVVVGVVALVAALATGATGVFNVLVFLFFGVLWACFAAALVFAPADLDALWRGYRQRNVVVQTLGWLLLLPVTAALFIWERRWQFVLFFPRG